MIQMILPLVDLFQSTLSHFVTALLLLILSAQTLIRIERAILTIAKTMLIASCSPVTFSGSYLIEKPVIIHPIDTTEVTIPVTHAAAPDNLSKRFTLRAICPRRMIAVQ